MLRIGIAGIGFMGMIHYLAAQRSANVHVTAFQSRDPKKRAGDWRGIRGNFGPPGQQMTFIGINAYETFDELIADPLVDLVDITTPTPQHEHLAIRALQAGKHVLVEKPITLEVPAADRMISAAKQSGRMLMVAQVLPCFSEFQFALESARSNRHGKLLAGHLMRVISQSDRLAMDVANTGGPAIDLHIHDTHFIRTLSGQPSEVVATGHVVAGDVWHVNSLYRYDAGPSLSCSTGALSGAARPFAHGFELYFEHATLSFGPNQPLTVIDSAKAETISSDSDPVAAFTNELERVAASVSSGVVEPFLAADVARDALILCHQEIESIKTGRPVAV